ncbi:uncharacterized protein LOC114523577 [Dendronephthya gigantea]|uniref:uncharacterized protein LOC114523577 n=1 Tax=Dendronephthya gigantea TaxID=151771 RepID=UPI001069C68C|nr:uncharacterized protein LOC114523577 [Dendronephthya gigantea]
MAGNLSKNMAIGAGVIGFILISCGLGCAVAGFVWTAYGKGAQGIWSGIFMIVVGAFGAVTLCTKMKGIMIVFLVMCIIDMILNAIQAIIAAIVLALVGLFKDALDNDRCSEYRGQCTCRLEGDTSGVDANTFTFDGCDDIDVMMASMRAVVAFSILGIIATFAGSIIGCIGACCDKSGPDTPGVVVIQQGQPMQTTTVQTFHHGAPQPPPPHQPYPPADNQPYPAANNQPYPAADPESGLTNPGY